MDFSLPTPPTTVKTRALVRGETLFRQSDATFAIFRVRRGRVRLVRHLADGTTVLLHLARAGETFAEAALFATEYHCDAVAEVDSEVEVHPRTELEGALADDPAAAAGLMKHLAKQVIDLRSRLELRNIRSADERVAQFLRLKADGGGAVTFHSPLKDIAAEIGLTHETFYRALSRLARAGVIVRHRRTVTMIRS